MANIFYKCYQELNFFVCIVNSFIFDFLLSVHDAASKPISCWNDFVHISSGLGDANPNSLLIVPMMVNKDIFGVIEIASFKPFEKYQIELVMKADCRMLKIGLFFFEFNSYKNSIYFFIFRV